MEFYLDWYRYNIPNHVGGEIQVLDGCVAVVAFAVGDGFHPRWVWYHEMKKCPYPVDYLELGCP